MKKAICILLALIMVVSFVACDKENSNSKGDEKEDYEEVDNDTKKKKDSEENDETSTNKAEDSVESDSEKNSEEDSESIELLNKENEIIAAGNAYKSLNEAKEYCENIMATIYNAWYFSIYQGEYYSNYEGILSGFCETTGLKKDDVAAKVEEYLEVNGLSQKDSQRFVLFKNSSSVVKIVLSIHIKNESYSTVSSLLDSAKESLKSVTSKYEDETGYSMLKSYHSAVSSYLEFCKSPSGSFNQLSTTIDTYENNCNKHKNDLSFVFD